MPARPTRHPFLSWLTPAVFLGAGLALCLHARALGLGCAAEPGPGMWPAFVGGGLTLGGLLLITIPAGAPSPPDPSSTLSPSEAAGRPGPDARALKGLGLGCAVWIALLIPLGWAPATLLTGLIFGRAAGDGWRNTFILAGLVLALGLGLETLLRFSLPGGLWSRVLDALAVWLAGPGGPA